MRSAATAPGSPPERFRSPLQDGLGHRHVDVLEDRQEQRGAPRVTHQHRLLVEAVVGQHLRQEPGNGLHVEAGVVRYLHGVPTLGQSPAQPPIPAALRVPTRSVEDDGVWLHRPVLHSRRCHLQPCGQAPVRRVAGWACRAVQQRSPPHQGSVDQPRDGIPVAHIVVEPTDEPHPTGQQPHPWPWSASGTDSRPAPQHAAPEATAPLRQTPMTRQVPRQPRGSDPTARAGPAPAPSPTPPGSPPAIARSIVLPPSERGW